jgi:hypothetical protein
VVGKLVQPAKIFEIKEKADLGLIVWKLKDFHEEKRFQTENGETINLVTEILDLKSKDDSISGVFRRKLLSGLDPSKRGLS